MLWMCRFRTAIGVGSVLIFGALLTAGSAVYAQSDDISPPPPNAGGGGTTCADPTFEFHPKCADWRKAVAAWKERQKAKEDSSQQRTMSVPQGMSAWGQLETFAGGATHVRSCG